MQFDQRVQDISAIESQMGIPLLSVTAQLEQPIDSITETFLNQQNSPFVESMWLLRASLLLSTPGHAPKTILFTSCNPGEGKSTFACAQACALAVRDAKVLLIDGDMRRPSIMQRFRLSNKVGLSSVLTGTARIEDAIQPIDAIPNLSVMTSGPEPPSAALLLGADNVGLMLQTLKQQYDFVVIDTPPLLGLVDSSSLAQFAEATVLVLSYDQLNKSQIGRAIKILSRVGHSVTGIALNFADPESLWSYGYGYGYSYKSSSPQEKSVSK